MKKFLTKLIALAIFVSLIFLNTSIVTCEAKSDSREMQSKADYNKNFSESNKEINLQDVEELRFRLLVMAVEQYIIEKYNTLDDREFEEDYLQFVYEKIE